MKISKRMVRLIVPITFPQSPLQPGEDYVLAKALPGYYIEWVSTTHVGYHIVVEEEEKK